MDDGASDNWAIIRKHDLAGMVRIDVVPIRDLVEHDVMREDGNLCWCHPEIDFEDGARVIMHGAADGRD